MIVPIKRLTDIIKKLMLVNLNQLFTLFSNYYQTVGYYYYVW